MRKHRIHRAYIRKTIYLREAGKCFLPFGQIARRNFSIFSKWPQFVQSQELFRYVNNRKVIHSFVYFLGCTTVHRSIMDKAKTGIYRHCLPWHIDNFVSCSRSSRPPDHVSTGIQFVPQSLNHPAGPVQPSPVHRLDSLHC